jgi:hypothetical protein
MTDLSVRSRMRRWLNSCRESAAIRSHRVERICDFLGVYLDATHRTVSQSCDRAGSYLVVTRCCGQTIILFRRTSRWRENLLGRSACAAFTSRVRGMKWWVSYRDVEV